MTLNVKNGLGDIIERGPEPEVTVVCITYDHEDFIGEALDSFLEQRTTFRFQIFVGEDRGPDGTADIIREYAAKYPGVVIPFIREKNMGAQRNLIDMCQRAGTKYIAFCEGDDFWTDEDKLQKQYDYMEDNPELSGCFHNTEIRSDEDWYLTSFYRPDDKGRRLIPASIPLYDQSIRAMRMGYYIRFGPAHTSSMFFKWNYDLDVPEWYYTTVFGDHPIMAMQIGSGLLGFLPDVMSVYRRHAGGAIMNSSERDHHLATREDWLVVLEGLAEHFHQNHGGFAVGDIEARMVTEMRNYLSHAARSQNHEYAIRAIAGHPLAFERMMSDYTQTSTLRYGLIARLWDSDAAGLRHGALSEVISVISPRIFLRRRQAAERNRAIDYDGLATSQKQSDVWLFMCDDKASYRNNVRSLYEYVVAYHPEVKPCWLTWSADVKKLLQSEGLPVSDLKSSGARTLLAEASVLFCESLRSDIFEMRGFNAGFRVVRLLDNQYYRNHEQGEPRLATEIRTEGYVPVDGSPRDWRSASNLVVTDSQVLADRLIATPGVSPSRVLSIATEPRLLAIPELLTPTRKKHVLVNPGDLSQHQTEAVSSWLTENADAVDDIAGRHGFVLDVYLPKSHRFLAPIREGISGLQHVEVLTTFDIYAHLERFAGAVSGLDPLVWALARKGVPVSMCIATDDGTHRSAVEGAWNDAMPGPVTDDWMEALMTIVAAVEDGASALPAGGRIEEYFGIALTPQADALESLYASVRAWIATGAVQ